MMGKSTTTVPTPTNPIILPSLTFETTSNHSSRNGGKVQVVEVHRWGAPYKSIPAEALSYQGVIQWFKNPSSQVSAHFVYPGIASTSKGYEATQMVKYADKAWAEAFYNPISVEIESADAIWLGHDPLGMHLLARQVAFLLKHFHLEPQWISANDIAAGKTGFCRHADLGSAGGGHTSCPTTDIPLWQAFCSLVIHEYNKGGFRSVWGQ